MKKKAIHGQVQPVVMSCDPICDFCINYNFNPNEEGAYIGNGFCNFLKLNKDPMDTCNQFSCICKKT